jgi:GNAT superfamily N-acetyltransferase
MTASRAAPYSPGAFVELVSPDEPWVVDLWHELGAPVCAADRPATCLVAREPGTGRVLGLARYFRTFPPEDGCGAVAIIPAAAHTGVGEALFRELVRHARHDGMRMLGTLVSNHDTLTLDFLRRANLPVIFSKVSGGMYIEIDLLAAARED